MGEVYRARDTRLDRLVAVKVLPPQLTDTAQALERFRREARAIASLNHPNICAVYDVGEDVLRSGETVHFLVMELLEGETLQQRLTRGPLDVAELIDVGTALSDALDAAHRKGIIHRDIKPANVLLTPRGPKMLDFGLAKTVPAGSHTAAAEEPTMSAEALLTNPGIAVGTVAYMSPEQVRGDELDARTDLFSLGLVLYEMAAGRPAFAGATTMATAAAILHEQPKTPRHLRPEVPSRLEEVILKAIEKDRDVRSQTAAELRADLKRLKRSMGSDSTPAVEPAPALRRIGTIARRHRLALGVGATIVALGLAARIPAVRRQIARWAGASPGDSALNSFQVRPLTTTGNADRPTVSPDGKWIVYVQHDGPNDSLWIRQTDQARTATSVPIVPAEPGVSLMGATVTPDGKWVDFVRGQGGATFELWRVPFSGGPRRRLVDHADSLVGWSADGRQMAFIRRNLEQATTSLIAASDDGTHERVVAARHAPASFPLVFSRNGNGFQRPAWSPGGDSIALVGGDTAGGGRRAVVVDAASGIERVLPTQGVECLVWLDASTLLVTLRGTPEGGLLQLWRMSYPDGSVSRITNDLSAYQGLSVTGDREGLVTAERAVVVGLWIGDGRAAQGTEFAAPALGLRRGWPGGIRLTWAGNRLVYPPGPAILAVEPGRREPEELIAKGRSPATTADGRTIVYVGMPTDDSAGLWKSDADGRHPVRLATGRAEAPVVTADDRHVIFMAGVNQYSLWTVSLEGGPATELVPGPASAPEVSPDGKLLLYGTADAAHPEGAMAVCDLPACTARRYVFPSPRTAYVRWTSAGHTLAYLDQATQSNIWLQPLEGGSPQQLTHFTSGRIAHFAWTRDGARLAVARTLAVTTDIVLFRGLMRKP